MPLYTIEIHGRAVQAIPAETVSDIEESLDTWVGADQKVVLQHNRTPLWDGDKTNVYVREAWPEEAAVWNASLRRGISTGDHDYGDALAVYLVPVIVPTHDKGEPPKPAP